MILDVNPGVFVRLDDGNCGTVVDVFFDSRIIRVRLEGSGICQDYDAFRIERQAVSKAVCLRNEAFEKAVLKPNDED